MTEDDIIKWAKGRKFTDEGARKFARSYIGTMLFAGVLVRNGNLYLTPEQNDALNEAIYKTRKEECR